MKKMTQWVLAVGLLMTGFCAGAVTLVSPAVVTHTGDQFTAHVPLASVKDVGDLHIQAAPAIYWDLMHIRRASDMMAYQYTVTTTNGKPELVISGPTDGAGPVTVLVTVETGQTQAVDAYTFTIPPAAAVTPAILAAPPSQPVTQPAAAANSTATPQIPVTPQPAVNQATPSSAQATAINTVTATPTPHIQPLAPHAVPKPRSIAAGPPVSDVPVSVSTPTLIAGAGIVALVLALVLFWLTRRRAQSRLNANFQFPAAPTSPASQPDAEPEPELQAAMPETPVESELAVEPEPPMNLPVVASVHSLLDGIEDPGAIDPLQLNPSTTAHAA